MPELDLDFSSVKLSQVDCTKVLTVMLYPDNEAGRKELKASANIESLLKICDSLKTREDSIEVKLLLSPDTLNAVILAPNPDTVVAKAIKNCAVPGSLSGEMLLLILACAEHSPMHASVNKAQYVIGQDLTGTKEGPASRASILKAWSQFKSVAHLWAALRMWNRDLGRQDDCNPAIDKGLLTDISQITPRFKEILPPFHRQGNCIPSAAIRWPDFGDRPSFGRPFAHIFRHSDAPLLSFSPGRRFPRPTPERVLVADHQSGSGFSGTVPSARQPRPVGT